MNPRRLAAIDAGTNTVLLCIAETDSTGIRDILYEAERFARLGEGLDRSGLINEAATGRLIAILREYEALAGEWGVEEIVIGATSASRDAANRDEIQRVVQQETGLTYNIISGEEEALLTFAGALSGEVSGTDGYLVFDVGGGSTEFMFGRRAAHRLAEPGITASLDIGSVRLTERFFSGLPPAPDEIRRAADFIRSELSGLPDEMAGAEVLLATSGSATTLAVLALGAPDWRAISDRAITVSLEDVQGWAVRAAGLTEEELLRLNPSVMAGRADVFPGGQLILLAVMEKFGFEGMRITGRGLRHGLLLERVVRQNKSVTGNYLEHPN